MFEEKPCQFEAIARIKPKPIRTPPKTNNALMKLEIFESFEYLERIFSACSATTGKLNTPSTNK